MIRYSEALQRIQEVALSRSMPEETLPLDQALNHVLSRDIESPEDIPSFTNSAMDGFTLCAEWTQSASLTHPLTFAVRGSVSAGEWMSPSASKASSASPCAIEIMTGAPVPSGPFDTVVKIEDVEVSRGSNGNPVQIRLTRPLQKGENIRGQGEDFRRGDKVATSGTLLSPEHLMALAGLGISSVRVRRRPRIALLATGNELTHYSEQNLAPGMIRNSTAIYLKQSVPYFGGEVCFQSIVRDDPNEFLKALEQARDAGADMILSTGAVSMGKHDFIQETITQAGAQIHYHKVAIRPGKPGLFAEFKEGPVFFGAPGNPISTVVALRFFVAPYIRSVMGLEQEVPIRAPLVERAGKPKDLRCFFKAHCRADPKGTQVRVLHGQPSFMVSSLLQANGWIVLPEDGTSVEAGTVCDVYPLYPSGFSFHCLEPDQVPPIQERCC